MWSSGRESRQCYYSLIYASSENGIPRVKCINSRISLWSFVLRLRSGLKTRLQRRRRVVVGVSREGRRTCKGDQSTEKPEKFIKRFLSWHRRTSVSDLLAPANDPACPQEDSLGVRLVERSDGSVRRSSKLSWNADGYHPLFARYPSELSSPPLPSAPLIDLHSIGGWTPPAPSFSRIPHSHSLSSAKD